MKGFAKSKSKDTNLTLYRSLCSKFILSLPALPSGLLFEEEHLNIQQTADGSVSKDRSWEYPVLANKIADFEWGG